MSCSNPRFLSLFRASPWLRAWRGQGAVRLAFVLLFAVLTGPPPAKAQEDSNASFWLQERQRQTQAHPSPESRVVQRPTHLLRRAAPVRGLAREVPPGGAGRAPPLPAGEIPADETNALAPAEGTAAAV